MLLKKFKLNNDWDYMLIEKEIFCKRCKDLTLHQEVNSTPLELRILQEANCQPAIAESDLARVYKFTICEERTLY